MVWISCSIIKGTWNSSITGKEKSSTPHVRGVEVLTTGICCMAGCVWTFGKHDDRLVKRFVLSQEIWLAWLPVWEIFFTGEKIKGTSFSLSTLSWGLVLLLDESPWLFLKGKNSELSCVVFWCTLNSVWASGLLFFLSWENLKSSCKALLAVGVNLCFYISCETCSLWDVWSLLAKPC